MNPLKKLLPHRKDKSSNFLVLEIGLGRVTAAIYKMIEARPHQIAAGRKNFSSYENIFEASLQAIDALAAINDNIPRKAILGVSDGVLRTTTTVASYTRPKPTEVVDKEEVEKVLEQIATSVKAEPLKVFFSTVASAKIDEATITNPVGLKGEKASLACFVALKSAEELAIFDKLIEELELSVNKVVPTSFAISRLVLKKNLNDALLLRVGQEKSEGALLSEGHIYEILPFDLGMSGLSYLTIGVEAIISLLEKDKRPQTIWLYPDEDEVDLKALVEKLSAFPWKERLHYEQVPTIVTEAVEPEVPAVDTGILALANEFLEN
jgi:hypothetical protein